jgi:hypothetical protein
MDVVKGANEGLRFLLELAALGALGYWGFRTGSGLPLKLLLGIGAPLLAAVVWGVFGSPRAEIPVRGAGLLALEVVVFGGAGLALYAAGRPGLAWAFWLIFALNRALLFAWGQ